MPSNKRCSTTSLCGASVPLYRSLLRHHWQRLNATWCNVVNIHDSSLVRPKSSAFVGCKSWKSGDGPIGLILLCETLTKLEANHNPESYYPICKWQNQLHLIRRWHSAVKLDPFPRFPVSALITFGYSAVILHLLVCMMLCHAPAGENRPPKYAEQQYNTMQ